jgi:hypothetical protein
MVAHFEYPAHSYRLTMHALIARAVLVGALAVSALTGQCMSYFQSFRSLRTSVVAGSSTTGLTRDRSSSPKMH